MRPIITLLTDFGTADGYVGEMKGVLMTAIPEATVIDVSHDVAAQDTEGARLAVARYWRRFPAGTVHVVVVDPGVGTDRVALAVESSGYFLVGPDNGVLSPALLIPSSRVTQLPIGPGASATFQGRDVFSPAAARLASGASLDDVGSPFDAAVIRRTPEPHRSPDGAVVGQVIHVDRFGNAVTNLIAPHGGEVEVGGRALPLARTYGHVEIGACVALVGSSGLVEIAQRNGSAAAALGLVRGTQVVLRVGNR